MVALTIVWSLSGVDGRNVGPAQLEVLRRLGSERHTLTLALPRLHRLGIEEIPPLLRMEPRPSTAPGGAGANDRPLYQVAAVPAGRYRLHPEGAGTSGWLMIGIGRDQFSLKSGPVGTPPQPIDLDFPVDVRAIVVRGDEQARRNVRALAIEPLSVVPAAARLAADYARRAVRYGTTSVYFLDDRAFPEPEAFWIGELGAPQLSFNLTAGPAPRPYCCETHRWTTASDSNQPPGMTSCRLPPVKSAASRCQSILNAAPRC